MKRVVYLLLLCLSPLLACAQWKTVEKSCKKQPAWVGGAERNYLIVSAEATTIEEAKEKILISLKQQIVGTVATKIESTTTIDRKETTIGNETDYTENVSSSIRSKLANIPFISDVSLSKAKDFYWEKLYNKKAKAYKYEYHIRYLFTDFEVSALVNQFNERESQLNTRLRQYEQNLDNIRSVEEIDRTLNELKAFQTEFDTDDPRRSQTEQLSNNYRKLYKAIHIRQENGTANDHIIVGLYLSDRLISYMQKPQLLSNCATRLSVSTENDLYFISYSNDACYEDDENYIDIRFHPGNQIVSKRIYLQ